MKFLFWMAAVWLGYTYLGYPLVLRLLSWVRPVHPVIREDYLPGVSVLVAARNEEKDIGWKVNETLQWDYPKELLSVRVASDASEDLTDEILKGIKDPRMTFVRMERRSGKNAALNRLAQAAPGELLFFTDANSHIPPHCLRKVVRHFADPRVGCVTGDTHSAEDSSDSVIEEGAGAYGGYESRIRGLESRIGSVLVCDGAIFCVRRSLYAPLLPELANDLELPLRIGAAGYWVRHEPEAQVFEKDTVSPWESFEQRRRISAQGMLGMWKLRSTLGGLRGWQFVSRKFLRWLTLVPLALLLVSSASLAATPLFALALAIQLVFYGMALAGLLIAAAGRSSNRWVSVPFYVVLGSASTLAGVFDACRGRRFAVWEIASLSRGAGP
ncbi:MAG TPA: glycosyltransferase family 2 protein [Terriglobia bacterium]|nr:glycosyltransferase family 2 protein [Terriglobia bacterium]